MMDVPDLYADEASVTVLPHGVVLTFVRAEPGVPDGPTGPKDVPLVLCGRVRLSRETAQAIATMLQTALMPPTGPKH